MIGIIPKKIKKAPDWYNLGFYLAGALLIVVVLTYATLFYFEGKALNSWQELEDKTAQVGSKEDKKTEVKVLTAKEKINDFSELLQGHKRASSFFAFLEETCHPKIWFSEVELNLEQTRALLSGKTSNFQTLGQQIFIFREQASIARVELINLSIGQEGETEFNFYLYFKPQIFQ